MTAFRAVFCGPRSRGLPTATYALTVVAPDRAEAMMLARLRARIEAPGHSLATLRELADPCAPQIDYLGDGPEAA